MKPIKLKDIEVKVAIASVDALIKLVEDSIVNELSVDEEYTVYEQLNALYALKDAIYRVIQRRSHE